MVKTVQTWKSVSAHKINKLLHRTGPVWQSNYYNHIIRTSAEYAHQMAYVLRNDMVLACDVARALPLLHGAPDRGGLGTSAGAPNQDGLATLSSFFPGKDQAFWPELQIQRGEALPRWSMDFAICHICFRLADSIPQSKLREWEAARARFLSRQKAGHVFSEADTREWKNLQSEIIEKYLDSGFGECLLRQDGVGALLAETLLHDHGKTCAIHAYGIMPNHIHVIAEFHAAQNVARASLPLRHVQAQVRDGLATSEQQGRGGLATSFEIPLQCNNPPTPICWNEKEKI